MRATAPRSAAAYMRRAIAKSGAIVAGPYSMSAHTTAVLDSFERHGALGQCEHLDIDADSVAVDGNGHPTAVLLRAAGALAYVLQCSNCWSDPTPGDPCDGCDRSLTFGRRVVLTPWRPAFPFVVVAVLCRECRRERL